MESTEEIEGALFGSGSNPRRVPFKATLSAQFAAMSHHQLQIEPAQVVLFFPEISNQNAHAVQTNEICGSPDSNSSHSFCTRVETIRGVMDMKIDVPTMMDASDAYEYFGAIIRPALLSALEKLVSPTQSQQQHQWELNSVADHVVFCLPTGSLRMGAAAIADVGGMLSFFHHGTCTSLSVLAHEIGHNLNLHHSNDVNGVEYADPTCYMGGSQAPPTWLERFLYRNDKWREQVSVAGYPKKAFNGHKHWVSGWFRDRAVEIDPTLPTIHSGRDSALQFSNTTSISTLHRIVSFVDYKHQGLRRDHVILVKVGPFFIQYNRAKDYNIDSPEPEKVTVTQAWSDVWSDAVPSTLVASLSQGETYIHGNYRNATIKNDTSGFSASSLTLIIQVCKLVAQPSGVLDYADVSIHIVDNDKGDSVHSMISFCPPNTGHKISGSGQPLTFDAIILGSFQVADKVQVVLCVLFWTCMLVFLVVFIDSIRCGMKCCHRRSHCQDEEEGPTLGDDCLKRYDRIIVIHPSLSEGTV